MVVVDIRRVNTKQINPCNTTRKDEIFDNFESSATSNCFEHPLAFILVL